MCVIEGLRSPKGAHPDRRDEIKAETDQVRKVVARETLIVEVCMDKPDPAKATSTSTRAAKLGDEKLLAVAYNHMADLAAPVNREPNLPVELPRELTEALREGSRDQLLCRDTALVEALEALELARLQANEVSMNLQGLSPAC